MRGVMGQGAGGAAVAKIGRNGGDVFSLRAVQGLMRAGESVEK